MFGPPSLDLRHQENLVSVVVPTYGRPRHLLEAVRSVYEQTHRPIELLIVDDASPVPVDIASLGVPLDEGSFSVRVLRHEENLGPGAARNTAVRECRGRYTVFLDDDDLLHSRRVEAGVAAIGANPMHACEVLGAVRPAYVGDRRRTLLADDVPATGQVMFRTCEIIPFDTSLRVSEDIDWWARMAPKAVFSWTPEPLVTIREHHGERQALDPLVRADCRRRVVERHLATLDRGARSRQFERCASAYLLADEGAQCVRWAARAIVARPRALGFKLAVHGALVMVGLERHRRAPADASVWPGRPSTGELDTSSVSVVIPVKNMETLLPAQVEALLRQRTHRPFEVIVVDNGSSDGTRRVAHELAQRHDAVRVVDAPVPGPNAARNVGIADARAEVIALCDADDVVDEHWLEALMTQIEADTYVAGAVVRGGPNTADVRRRWGQMGATAVVPISKVGGHLTPISASCAFPKQMWEALGGFAEGLGIGGDESEFFVRASKAGYRCVEAPTAIVDYRLPSSARGVWRRGFNYGSNGWRVRHAAGDGRLLTVNIKQIVLLAVALPKAAFTADNRYTVLHQLAKRCGETSAMTRHLVARLGRRRAGSAEGAA